MHSRRDETTGIVAHYHGDFSGDIVFVIPGDTVRITSAVLASVSVSIPAKFLLELVAWEYVLPRKIGCLEQASPEELLGVEGKNP